MGFPFESCLSQHKITHRTYASLKCMKKNCDKCFKNVGNLNQHVKHHKCWIWFYCDFCDYKNKDKRNTDSHQQIHVVGDEKYSCNTCKERFRFSTQRSETSEKRLCAQARLFITDLRLRSYCLLCILLKLCSAVLFYYQKRKTGDIHSQLFLFTCWNRCNHK